MHDSNDSNASTDYVIGSLHEGFMKGMMVGTHITPWRMTRRWSGRTEGMRVRVRMGIVTRLKSERCFVW